MVMGTPRSGMDAGAGGAGTPSGTHWGLSAALKAKISSLVIIAGRARSKLKLIPVVRLSLFEINKP